MHTKTSESLIAAFYANDLKTIKVANRPPRQAGCVIQVISAEQFAEEEGIHYTEATLIERSAYIRLWVDQENPLYTEDFIYAYLWQRPSVVIADTGRMGRGAFLDVDSAPIKPGDIVWAGYGGEIFTRGYKPHSRDYAFTRLATSCASDSEEAKASMMATQLSTLDAKHYRGIAAYFQHAPNEEHLTSVYQVDTAIQPYIFTANLGQLLGIINNVPVMLFQAIRPIMPGDPLTFCYDVNYPENHPETQFCVFNRNAQIIGEIHGKRIKALSGCETHLQEKIQPYAHPGAYVINNHVKPDYRLEFVRDLELFLQQEVRLNDSFSLAYQLCQVVYLMLQNAVNNINSTVKTLKHFADDEVGRRFVLFSRKGAEVERSFGRHFQDAWQVYFLNRITTNATNYYRSKKDPAFREHMQQHPDLSIAPMAFDQVHFDVMFCQRVISSCEAELKNQPVYANTILEFLEQLVEGQPTDPKAVYQRFATLARHLQAEDKAGSRHFRGQINDLCQNYNLIQAYLGSAKLPHLARHDTSAEIAELYHALEARVGAISNCGFF